MAERLWAGRYTPGETRRRARQPNAERTTKWSRCWFERARNRIRSGMRAMKTAGAPGRECGPTPACGRHSVAKSLPADRQRRIDYAARSIAKVAGDDAVATRRNPLRQSGRGPRWSTGPAICVGTVAEYIEAIGDGKNTAADHRCQSLGVGDIRRMFFVGDDLHGEPLLKTPIPAGNSWPPRWPVLPPKSLRSALQFLLLPIGRIAVVAVDIGAKRPVRHVGPVVFVETGCVFQQLPIDI